MKSGGSDAGKHTAIVFYVQDKGFDIGSRNGRISFFQNLGDDFRLQMENQLEAERKAAKEKKEAKKNKKS